MHNLALYEAFITNLVVTSQPTNYSLKLVNRN